MKVSITASDIAQGQKCSARFCPLAIAMSRAMERDIWIGWSYAYSHPDTLPKFIMALPEAAQEFVVRMDKGETMEPIEFEITT